MGSSFVRCCPERLAVPHPGIFVKPMRPRQGHLHSVSALQIAA